MNLVYIKYLFLGTTGILVGILVDSLTDVLIRQRAGKSFMGSPQILMEKKPKYIKLRRNLVLVIFLILTVITWAGTYSFLEFLISISMLIYLGIVFTIDLEYRVIFNSVIVFGVLLSTMYGSIINGVENTLLGGAVGLIVFLLLYSFGKIIMPIFASLRNINLVKQAMYKNDVFMGLIIGSILGWKYVMNGIFIVLLFIGIAGLTYSIFMILQRKYEPNMTIPLGPFMILGTVMSCLIL